MLPNQHTLNEINFSNGYTKEIRICEIFRNSFEAIFPKNYVDKYLLAQNILIESVNNIARSPINNIFAKGSFHTAEPIDNNNNDLEKTKSFKENKQDFVNIDNSESIEWENVPTKARYKKSLSDSNFETFFYYVNQKYDEMIKEDDSKNCYSDSCNDTDENMNI